MNEDRGFRWREASAKLNLGLRITGRRPDGFHAIESIFVPLRLHDSLAFRDATEDSFHCDDPELPAGGENLVLRALEAWRAETGDALPWEISLRKKIPAGAGLGGGSSDAAACLLELDCRNPGRLKKKDLHKIALLLGSDVPFFLETGWTHVSGRGEVLTQIPALFDGQVVLVWPGIHVSTAAAYARIAELLTCREGYAKFKGSERFAGDPENPASWPENQFERVIFPQYPELAELKREFETLGSLYSSMSGSGSSIYGFFDSDRSAQQAARHFSGRFPSTILTHTR